MEAPIEQRTLNLIAMVIDACAGVHDHGHGHPPAQTVRVLATLRLFVRDGTLWRRLPATADRASGSTLRQRPQDWAADNLSLTRWSGHLGKVCGYAALAMCS
jgi:hypothetical protein